MDSELYIAFVIVSSGLILIPGPNVLLIISNSISHGTRAGLLTVAGTSTAMAIQLAITAFGLTSLMLVLVELFEYLRWLGVVYLIYLGVMKWRNSFKDDTDIKRTPAPKNNVYWQGFFVSLVNPKTLFFFAAFLPQFIDYQANAITQLLILSVSFLMLAIVFDSLYALLSNRVRRFNPTTSHLWKRLSGTLLIGAGIGLGLVGRK